MAEKVAKKKPAAGKSKAAAQESGVLAALPSTRSARLSRRARPSTTTAAPARPPKPAAKPRPARKAKPRKPTVTATAGPAATAKPAAPKAPPRTTAADATVTSISETPTKPRAVRAGTPRLAEKSKNKPAARRPPEVRPPSGTELVTTVVQAAGELAQVGLTVGGQMLKRAVQKLPKP